MAHKTKSNFFRHRGDKTLKAAAIESIVAADDLDNRAQKGATVTVRRDGGQWVVEVQTSREAAPVSPR